MRRTLTVITTVVALTAINALPALAAGAEAGEIAKGSVQGIALAFVLGVLIGVGLTIHAYGGVRFGEAPGHHQYADDIRQGLSDYDPDMVETEREIPSGTA